MYDSIIDKRPNITIPFEQSKEDFEKLVIVLGTPVIDYQRSVISLSLIIITIVLLLYLIPRIREICS